MLFEKSIYDLTFDDIKDFCSRNDEGYRVEYKSNFDESVRKNIAKMVSAFANAHGGVIIMGVATNGNKPVDPIVGFEKPTSEEIRLTIQNICRQAIFPSLFPAIREIDTETQNHVVVVIFVEESTEAPHAIENSKKVYIRTGDAINPFDIAELNVIKALFQKRKIAESKIRDFEEYSDEMFRSIQLFDYKIEPYIDIVISPQFPIKPITSKEFLFEQGRRIRIERGDIDIGLFEASYLRRVNLGIMSNVPPNTYFYLNEYGFLNYKIMCEKRDQPMGNNRSIIQLVFHQMCRSLSAQFLLYNAFINSFHWNGNLRFSISLQNIKGYALNIGNINSNHMCLDNKSYAQYEIDSQILVNQRNEIFVILLKELIWCFNQSVDNFTDQQLLAAINGMNGI